MSRRRGILAIFFMTVACMMAGCSDKPVDPAPKQDQTLTQHQRAGELAYSLDRPEEAVAQYRIALAQAEARDDLPAIGNLSFNLVVAQLRANQPADALATARQTKAELQRRGSGSFPALDLAEATALYRTGDIAGADAAAARLQASDDADTRASADFLRGLIADDRNDTPGLQTVVQVLAGGIRQPGAAMKPDQQADLAELQARLARRQGDFTGARQQALHAADLRRDLFDYRGLARALSVAADAAERRGDAASSADLYLRAGRSAAAQHDPVQARPWLEHALRLSRDPAIRSASQEALDSLIQPGTAGGS
jgi:hypothetical protein